MREYSLNKYDQVTKGKFNELAFLSTIVPQIVTLRKLNNIYPWFAGGLKIVVNGGTERADGTFLLQSNFMPFCKQNTAILKKNGILENTEYWKRSFKHIYHIPFEYNEQHVVDYRFKTLPYHGSQT